MFFFWKHVRRPLGHRQMSRGVYTWQAVPQLLRAAAGHDHLHKPLEEQQIRDTNRIAPQL